MGKAMSDLFVFFIALLASVLAWLAMRLGWGGWDA